MEMNAGKLFFKQFFGWIFLSFFLVNLTNGGRVTPRISSFAKRTIFPSPGKAIPGPEKNYTGIRISYDSVLLLNYHEQTIAVVEVGLNGTLFNCELLEVRTEADQKVALHSLKPLMAKVTRISFNDMLDLMSLCQKLDPPFKLGKELVNERAQSHVDPRQFTSIFSGVFPGTKWCGTGDIAVSYHDLGLDQQLDKCCRTHDLCPVKIPGLKTQYNLTNYAVYTSSHCSCDEIFYNCLKSVGTTVSNLLGGIYFNVNPGHCVEDVPNNYTGVKPGKRFTKKNFRF